MNKDITPLESRDEPSSKTTHDAIQSSRSALLSLLEKTKKKQQEQIADLSDKRHVAQQWVEKGNINTQILQQCIKFRISGDAKALLYRLITKKIIEIDDIQIGDPKKMLGDFKQNTQILLKYFRAEEIQDDFLSIVWFSEPTVLRKNISILFDAGYSNQDIVDLYREWHKIWRDNDGRIAVFVSAQCFTKEQIQILLSCPYQYSNIDMIHCMRNMRFLCRQERWSEEAINSILSTLSRYHPQVLKILEREQYPIKNFSLFQNKETEKYTSLITNRLYPLAKTVDDLQMIHDLLDEFSLKFLFFEHIEAFLIVLVEHFSLEKIINYFRKIFTSDQDNSLDRKMFWEEEDREFIASIPKTQPNDMYIRSIKSENFGKGFTYGLREWWTKEDCLTRIHFLSYYEAILMYKEVGVSIDDLWLYIRSKWNDYNETIREICFLDTRQKWLYKQFVLYLENKGVTSIDDKIIAFNSDVFSHWQKEYSNLSWYKKIFLYR